MDDLVPWQAPPTTSSLAQKSAQARTLLSRSTSPLDAAKAAKKLVGSYANLRPGDPATFVESIAEVLQQYPRGVVDECVDVRTGIARKLEFLSVRGLVDHLEARMELHKTLAAWRPRPEVRALPPPPTLPPEHRAGMIERFRALLARVSRAPDPGTSLIRAHRQQHQDRLAADKARALADLQAAE